MRHFVCLYNKFDHITNVMNLNIENFRKIYLTHSKCTILYIEQNQKSLLSLNFYIHNASYNLQCLYIQQFNGTFVFHLTLFVITRQNIHKFYIHTPYSMLNHLIYTLCVDIYKYNLFPLYFCTSMLLVK